MTTTRIREKISALVGSQLPEFIQSDFPTFVSFIEAYYRFLEQDQGALELVQNARSYNDIDTTTDDFVKYFLKNYAANFPENTLVNKRFLVKRINDIYTAKGSSLSFDVLFRTIFDTSVEVKTPFDFVLRASDGRWDQRVSLRLKTISGNRNDLQNRFLPYKIGGIDYSTPILNVKNLTSTLTEVFLDRNLIAPRYNIGDTVRILNGSGNVVFTGTIEPTTTGYSVLRPGSGFKVGQVYTVSSGTAVDTLIKITKVSLTGGIEEIKFLVYGYGFNIEDEPLLLDFDPTKNFSQVVDAFRDLTGGFTSDLSISDLTQNYFQEDYVPTGYMLGNTLTSAFNTSAFTPQVAGTKPPQIASISFSFGALGRYPGQFIKENGFLSEPDVRLQDSLLYQAFAYQTNTDIDRSEFFDVVKKLIHPAGQNLFNNRLIQANVDLASNVALAFVSNIFFEATDSFTVTDSIQIDVNKFSDSAGVFDSKLNYLISKTIDDSFEALENVSIETNLNVFDNTQTSDVDSLSIEPNYIDFVDSKDSNVLFSIELNFVDTLTIFDKPIVFPSLTSPATVVENASINLENNGIPDDSVSFSDPFTVGYFVTREFTEQRSNDYFLEFYADDYAQVTGLVMTDFTTVSVQPLLSDTPTINESLSLEIQVGLLDGIVESDAAISSLFPNLIYYPNYIDTQTLRDNVSIQLFTTINNEVNFSEQVEGINLNYASPEYFAGAYAGEIVIQQP